MKKPTAKLTKQDLEYLESVPKLILILYKEPFDDILKDEKHFEYRDATEYWQTRLKKFYDLKAFWIEFRNGYAKDSPKFKALCMGIFDNNENYALEIIGPNSIKYTDETNSKTTKLFDKVHRLEHNLPKAIYIKPQKKPATKNVNSKSQPKLNIMFRFINKLFGNGSK